MKILFITQDYPTASKGSNIYTDLSEALLKKGHKVKVVVSEEKKNIIKTKLNNERGLEVLRVKTGNIYEVNLFEKAISFLRVGNQLIKSINKYFKEYQFDLILFHTPPVTFNKTIKWVMNKYKAPSYLMMKDIFPQNGLDIGIYSKHNPMYIYFKKQEQKLYKTATKIGCMSEGNIKYLLKENKYLKKNKLEIFPNTVFVKDFDKTTIEEKQKIRKKYNIDKKDVVAIFGGNFGKPQGIDFLIKIIDFYKNREGLKFLLIGRGTEKKRLFNYIDENKINNVIKYDYMPRNDYENLLSSCDIGLIFLDSRFTIPNFPSKTLSYLECALPIMAAIDKNTDYGRIIEKAQFGYYVISGDINKFDKKFTELLTNKKLRIEMGKKGRNYLEKECNVEKSVKILEDFMKRSKKNV